MEFGLIDGVLETEYWTRVLSVLHCYSESIANVDIRELIFIVIWAIVIMFWIGVYKFTYMLIIWNYDFVLHAKRIVNTLCSMFLCHWQLHEFCQLLQFLIVQAQVINETLFLNHYYLWETTIFTQTPWLKVIFDFRLIFLTITFFSMPKQQIFTWILLLAVDFQCFISERRYQSSNS